MAIKILYNSCRVPWPFIEKTFVWWFVWGYGCSSFRVSHLSLRFANFLAMDVTYSDHLFLINELHRKLDILQNIGKGKIIKIDWKKMSSKFQNSPTFKTYITQFFVHSKWLLENQSPAVWASIYIFGNFLAEVNLTKDCILVTLVKLNSSQKCISSTK